MKKIWFVNIFGTFGAENIFKPDLFHDFQLGLRKGICTQGDMTYDKRFSCQVEGFKCKLIKVANIKHLWLEKKLMEKQ